MYACVPSDTSLGPGWPCHRVISDRVHCLFVTLSYFQPDRFVQLLSLIPILISLLYLVVNNSNLASLEERRRQLLAKLKYISLALTRKHFSFKNYHTL